MHGPSSTATSDTAVNVEQNQDFRRIQADLCEYSRDGKLLVLASRDKGFVVLNSFDGSTVCEKDHPGIQAVAVSPCAKHIVTWERYDKTDTEGNLIVWAIPTGDIVSRFIQKSYSKQFWPPVQWTDDEALCARMTPNQVQLFNGQNLLGGPISRISQQV